MYDANQAHLHGLVQILRNVTVNELNVRALLCAKLPAQSGHDVDEPQKVQRGWMQAVRQLVKAGRTLRGHVRDRVQLSSIVRRQVCALAEPVDADLKNGQLLRHIVVQLSGDSGALFVLRADQAARQFLNLLFRRLALRDVHERAYRSAQFAVLADQRSRAGHRVPFSTVVRHVGQHLAGYRDSHGCRSLQPGFLGGKGGSGALRRPGVCAIGPNALEVGVGRYEDRNRDGVEQGFKFLRPALSLSGDNRQ